MIFYLYIVFNQTRRIIMETITRTDLVHRVALAAYRWARKNNSGDIRNAPLIIYVGEQEFKNLQEGLQKINKGERREELLGFPIRKVDKDSYFNVKETTYKKDDIIEVMTRGVWEASSCVVKRHVADERDNHVLCYPNGRSSFTCEDSEPMLETYFLDQIISHQPNPWK